MGYAILIAVPPKLMNKSDLSSCNDRERRSRITGSSTSSSPVLRVVTWLTTAVWRTCVDWRTKRPLFTRVTAHLSVVVLAIVAILLGGIGIPMPRAALGEASVSGFAWSELSDEPTEVDLTPVPSIDPSVSLGRSFDADIILRQPIPHTTRPDRLRAEAISYQIQEGDNIFDIAARFQLSPETIVWSNRETLADAPWLIQPGLELHIPPVDGVYYTVRSGDTIASVAEEYKIQPDAVYNEWNKLKEGSKLVEGQLLVLPGATGDDVVWAAPVSASSSTGSAGYSYGICSGVSFTGPGANGWFSLPTGSYAVSGWYFHDVRNPTHIGLDYRCRLGDPIYAAENGVVTIAGWNGGYGILVEINHGNGFVTRYGHNDSLAVGCGDPVYQGQVIGYCGTTGYSTGPHLHYEIRANGVPQDPQTYEP